jgi:hypothetical protein
LERLEGRELLTVNPLGYALPDLIVTGYASPVAAWGGPLTVTVDVSNIGSTASVDPQGTFFGTNSAAAPPTNVTVYAFKSPHNPSGGVAVGTLSVPAIDQNDFVQTTQTITMPSQPIGFPGNGHKIYLVFQVNSTSTVYESTIRNNVSSPVPLTIGPALPDVQVVGLGLPSVMQPGDTIQPNIRLTNIGPADTNLQGPLTVALVASTQPFVNSGSTIVAEYTVANIPGATAIATSGNALSDANQTPGANTVDIVGTPVTLPVSPKTYFLGVVIDPFNQIQKITNFRHGRQQNPFMAVRTVGPPINGLPPAGELVSGGAANVPTFPIPFANQPIGGVLGGTFPITPPPSPPTVPG